MLKGAHLITISRICVPLAFPFWACLALALSHFAGAIVFFSFQIPLRPPEHSASRSRRSSVSTSVVSAFFITDMTTDCAFNRDVRRCFCCSCCSRESYNHLINWLADARSLARADISIAIVGQLSFLPCSLPSCALAFSELC